MNGKKTTTCALEILRAGLIGDDPEMERLYKRACVNADIARQVYNLREKHGLTQAALARKIGAKAADVSNLEDADYEGDSGRMLERIKDALKQGSSAHFIAPRSIEKSSPLECGAGFSIQMIACTASDSCFVTIEVTDANQPNSTADLHPSPLFLSVTKHSVARRKMTVANTKATIQPVEADDTVQRRHLAAA
jgi:transcriptional regulator with XRE-family HTH domain